MTEDQLSAVRALYERGASFTRLRGKVPVDTGWQSRPRETLDDALAMAAAGNIGIRTGAASLDGLIVFDVEAKAEPGTYEALGLPPTMTVKTGRGGRHYYFRWPHQSNGRVIKNTASKIAQFVDTRGWGGQVVFPGSVHPDTGQLYEFMDDPAVTEIAVLPEEFVERHAAILLKDYKRPRPDTPRTPTPQAPAGASKYAAAALDGECRKVAGAPEGTRNDTLNAAAFSLGQLVGAGALYADDVEGALLAAAFECGLGEHEAHSAIRSGMTAGAAQPRDIPAPRSSTAPARQAPPPSDPVAEWMPTDEDNPGSGPELPDEPGDAPNPPQPAATRRNPPQPADGDDEGDGSPGYSVDNVVRLFLLDNRRIIYYRDIFYRYTGRCYRPMTDNELRGRIVEFIIGSPDNRRLWTVARGREHMEEIVSPGGRDVSKSFDMIRGFGMTNYSPDIPFWLGTGRPAANHVGLENGILNLDTYEMLPHTADCFTLAALPFDYDPAAECPEWTNFLNEIFMGDEESLLKLQEIFGYCLQSSQDAQNVFVFQGEGKNGKTVVANVLKAMVGPENCSAVPLESLHQPHATTAMIGKMVNFSMEWKYIAPEAEGLLKAISGGDPVNVNPKHKSMFPTSLPTKLVILSNEPPHIADRTEGMWRRIQIVPFDYVVPDHKRIPMASLLRIFGRELPGILNWSIEGLRSWRQQGAFTTSQKMLDAVETYRRGSSTVISWADDSIELVPDFRSLSGELYRSYTTWCKDNGCKASNSTNFGLELSRWYKLKAKHDLKRVRVQEGGSRKNYYDGIGLIVSGDLPQGLDGYGA